MLSTDVLHDVQVFSILAAIMHVRMDHPQHACSSVWSLVYASDTVCCAQSGIGRTFKFHDASCFRYYPYHNISAPARCTDIGMQSIAMPKQRER